MIFLDRFGWPIERIRGHVFSNLIRTLLHVRSIVSNKEWKRRQERLTTKCMNKNVTASMQRKEDD